MHGLAPSSHSRSRHVPGHVASLHADGSSGSRHARRLRLAGSIPAVVYGEGVAPLAISVDAKEFRTAVSGEQGLNSLIDLDADGQKYLVMAREIQRHPVRGTVAHIDFQVIDPNKPVVAEVPLHLVGDAVEVRHADWEVDQQMFSLEIKARPDQIPTHIDVDDLRPRRRRVDPGRGPGAARGCYGRGGPAATVVTTHPGRAAKTAAPAEARS